MKSLREAFGKIDDAVDFSGTVVPSTTVLPKLNVNCDVLSCYKEILRAKM
jgi:hypothetical protein